MWGSSVDPLLATAAAALLQDAVTESDVDVALSAAEAGGPNTSTFDLRCATITIFPRFFVVSFGMNERNTYLHVYVQYMWYACIFISDEKHRALLLSSERTIAPGGCVLVFYTHHRPQLAHRDMEFVKMAGEMRWECEKVLTVRLSGKCTPYGRSGRDFFSIHSTRVLSLLPSSSPLLCI